MTLQTSCIIAVFGLCLLGHRVRSQECIDGCSDAIEDENIFAQCPVSCTTEQQQFVTNESDASLPSKPLFEREERMWYFYHSTADGKIKIALNISWSSEKDPFVDFVFAYKIELEGRNKSVYYLINPNTNRSRENNTVPSFYYDCFGRLTDLEIKPGDEFDVKVTSYSSSGTASSNRVLYIPLCNDEKMKDSIFCKATIHVGDACTNRTRTISYQVPGRVGSTASILLCQPDLKTTSYCSNAILMLSDLPLNGAREIRISSKFNLNHNYSLQVWNSNVLMMRYEVVFNFSACSDEESAPRTSVLFIMLCLFLALILILTIGGIVAYILGTRYTKMNKSTKYCGALNTL